MCYLVREHQAGAAERGGTVLPPSFDRLRSRWIGAVAAALVAGVAVAAFITPPAPPRLDTKSSAPVTPLASKAAIVPAAAVVEQSSAGLDDGVPSTTGVARAGIGHCEHGL